MTEITIPPEAVEAAVQAYLSTPGRTASIRAAIRAALAAWPGMAVNDGCPVWHAYPHLTLPLPQDKQS